MDTSSHANVLSYLITSATTFGFDAVEALATTAQESNTTNAPIPIQFITVSNASDASFDRAADPRMTDEDDAVHVSRPVGAQ